MKFLIFLFVTIMSMERSLFCFWPWTRNSTKIQKMDSIVPGDRASSYKAPASSSENSEEEPIWSSFDDKRDSKHLQMSKPLSPSSSQRISSELNPMYRRSKLDEIELVNRAELADSELLSRADLERRHKAELAELNPIWAPRPRLPNKAIPERLIKRVDGLKKDKKPNRSLIQRLRSNSRRVRPENGQQNSRNFLDLSKPVEAQEPLFSRRPVKKGPSRNKPVFSKKSQVPQPRSSRSDPDDFFDLNKAQN